jgi:hypothetical protein
VRVIALLHELADARDARRQQQLAQLGQIRLIELRSGRDQERSLPSAARVGSAIGIYACRCTAVAISLHRTDAIAARAHCAQLCSGLRRRGAPAGWS